MLPLVKNISYYYKQNVSIICPDYIMRSTINVPNTNCLQIYAFHAICVDMAHIPTLCPLCVFFSTPIVFRLHSVYVPSRFRLRSVHVLTSLFRCSVDSINKLTFRYIIAFHYERSKHHLSSNTCVPRNLC